MRTPYSLRSFDEVTSTQDVVREHVAEIPYAVIANRQTAGRGRSGREWITAPRAVAVSVGWHTEAPTVGVFPLLAGLAAHRVVGGGLKWPNDVLIGENKVGGILAERTGELVVIGMGLNLWWPDAPAGVTALWDDEPKDDAGSRLATEWVEQLLALVETDPWPRTDYVAVCTTIGREIVWEPDGRGRAVDIAPDGTLVVETSSGRVQLHSGQVRNVRTRR